MKKRKGSFNLTGLTIAVLGGIFMFAQTATAYLTVDDGGCKNCHTPTDYHNSSNHSGYDFNNYPDGCLDCHVTTPGDTPETSACTSCHPGGDVGSEQLQTSHIESVNVPGGSCFPCHADDTDVYGNISGDLTEGVAVYLYAVDCGATPPYAAVKTDSEGYYSFGNIAIANGRYIVAPDETGYFFSSGYFIDIPQGTIQPYDFTSTAE